MLREDYSYGGPFFLEGGASVCQLSNLSARPHVLAVFQKDLVVQTNENKMFYSMRLATNGFETRIHWILIIRRITGSSQRAVVSLN
jgi:hypothetical protein